MKCEIKSSHKESRNAKVEVQIFPRSYQHSGLKEKHTFQQASSRPEGSGVDLSSQGP